MDFGGLDPVNARCQIPDDIWHFFFDPNQSAAGEGAFIFAIFRGMRGMGVGGVTHK